MRRAPTADAVSNGDGELEIVEFEDDAKPFIMCRAEGAREVGFVHLTPQAGEGCLTFREPQARVWAASYVCRCGASSEAGPDGACAVCGGRVSA
jgi:hypothetical protein